MPHQGINARPRKALKDSIAGFYVRGHVLEHVPLTAEVFHELAWQLDGVPFHAADARDIALVDLGEHVVQAVAELMEQHCHVVVREQGGLAGQAFGEVADPGGA